MIVTTASLSSWRAWIEINVVSMVRMELLGRSPHGERGLKSRFVGEHGAFAWSLSSWRAWIEMEMNAPRTAVAAGRSPHGERGLK